MRGRALWYWVAGFGLLLGGLWGAWAQSRPHILWMRPGQVQGATAISWDGRLLADEYRSTGAYTTVRVRSLENGLLVRTFMVPELNVESLAFSPDNRYLAVAGFGLHLIDTASGEIRRLDTGTDSPRSEVVFSADGRWMGIATSRSVRIWRTADWVQMPPLPTTNTYAIAFSYDGSQLAYSPSPNVIQIFSLTEWAVIRDINTTDRSFSHLVFSPDGQALVLRSHSNQLLVWRVADGQQIASLGTFSGFVEVSYSPDGRLLGLILQGSDRSELRIWRVFGQTYTSVASHQFVGAFARFCRSLSEEGVWEVVSRVGNAIAISPVLAQPTFTTLLGTTAGVWSVAASRDGQWLAAGGSSGVDVYLATSTVPRYRLQLGGITRGVTFSPDSTVLAFNTGDTVRLFDLAAGQIIASLAGHTSVVLALDFSPDGVMLASGGADRTVRVWRKTAGNEWQLLRLLYAEAQVQSVKFSPDGQWLAIATESRTYLYRVSDWQLVSTFAGRAPLVFATDSTRLYAAGLNGLIYIWRVPEGTLWKRLETPYLGTAQIPVAMVLSPSGDRLAFSLGGGVSVIDLSTGESFANYALPSSINAVAFTADGQKILVGSQSAFLAPVPERKDRVIHSQIGSGTLVFDPAGEWIAASGAFSLFQQSPPWACVWRVQDGSHLTTLLVGGSPTAVATSPRGYWLFLSTLDGGIDIWNTAEWSFHDTYFDGSNGITTLTFSPVFSEPTEWLLASGGVNGIIHLTYTSSAGTWRRTLLWHQLPISAIGITPDGRWLVSGVRQNDASQPTTVVVWRLPEGVVSHFLPHGGSVYSAAISPNGELLATASGDERVRLWRIASGQLVGAVQANVSSVSFSRSGNLLGAGGDRGITIWSLTTGERVRFFTEEISEGVREFEFSPVDEYQFAYLRGDSTLVLATILPDPDGNGCVDDQDLLTVLFAYGQQGAGLDADVTFDGVVDDQDLIRVLFEYGTGCN